MSVLIFALFVVGGFLFARLAAFPKFALWSITVSAAYGVFLAVTQGRIGNALAVSVAAFVCLQVSYVAGAGFFTATDRHRGAEPTPGWKNGAAEIERPIELGDRQARQ